MFALLILITIVFIILFFLDLFVPIKESYTLKTYAKIFLVLGICIFFSLIFKMKSGQ